MNGILLFTVDKTIYRHRRKVPTITFLKRIKMVLKIPEKIVSNDHNYTLKQTVNRFQKPKNYRRTHPAYSHSLTKLRRESERFIVLQALLYVTANYTAAFLKKGS